MINLRNWTFTKYLLLATTVSIIAGCGGGGSSSSGGGSGGGSGVQGQLNSKTLLFDKNASSQIIGQDTTSMTFAGNRTDIKPGSVILNLNGKGGIRKVKSVTQSGGKTIAKTENAGLDDAVDKLTTKTKLAFDKDAIGAIQSKKAGLSFAWVKGSTTKGRDTSFNVLEINFSKLAIGTSQGLSIDGTATFQADPEFDLNMDREPGKILPTVSYLKAGMSASLGGSLTIESKFGGSVSATETFFDDYIGKPLVYGWLVFIPRLKIEVGVEGTASGAISHTQTLGVDTTVSETYTRSGGWKTSYAFDPSYSATETGVDAEFGFRIKPLVVTLAYELYGVAGPFASIEEYAEATGKHDIQNSVEGIQAAVNIGLEGALGLVAEAPAGIEELFGVSYKPFVYTFDIKKRQVFSKFFPFTGTSSISVGDNGPAPDDIFSVTLDGTLLGQTDKGGTGAFRVTSLRPGNHTLTIQCLDDGANGADIGTLGISLANGFTFLNGGTTLSDTLALGESRDYVVVVPDTTQPWKKALPIPKSKVLTEHPRKR